MIVLYLTKVMRFAGAIRVTGDLYEDREKLWPGKPGKADAYPWRFPTEPVVVVDEDDWVPAEELATHLEHVRKWPAEHWKLAFQGQLRTVSDADATSCSTGCARRRRAGMTSSPPTGSGRCCCAPTTCSRTKATRPTAPAGAQALEEAREVARDPAVDPRVRELVERRA